jgi:hypothetical protein
MGRCLGRKDETKIHAELRWGNLLQQEIIENGEEKVWGLTLVGSQWKPFLMWNILSGHAVSVNCAEALAKTMSSEYGRVRGLPPSAYSLFIYSSLFAYINQGKALVASEVYHMVITANICMNRMGRRLAGNIRKMCWRESVRDRYGGWRSGTSSGATV